MLGIPTQAAAADLAGISINTWQRLENGQQISMSSLSAIAKALQWPATHAADILHGRVLEDAEQPARNAEMREAGPLSLIFVSSDGSRHEVDGDRWSASALSSRDRAILKALLSLVDDRLAESVPGPPDPKETARAEDQPA
jgi:transcriptional regulator with XRE-family HTH domain